MTVKEKIEKDFEYIHKMAQAKGISYQDALKLAIVEEYINYVDTIDEINSQ
jgi:hypothetical protein